MIDIVMWFMIIFSFVFNLVSLVVIVTLVRGLFRLMDNVDEIDEHLALLEHRKQDKPLPPPNTVPLEQM